MPLSLKLAKPGTSSRRKKQIEKKPYSPPHAKAAFRPCNRRSVLFDYFYYGSFYMFLFRYEVVM
jgi:hypothetical protein